MPYVTRDVEGVVDGLYANLQPGWAEEYLEDNDPEVQAFLYPPQTPLNSPLTPDQFYSMLDIAGKLDATIAAIETVTPTAKKLTCRNQFNNAQLFYWDMVLVQMVMPKPSVYGSEWQETLGPLWVSAHNTLGSLAAE